MASERDAAKKAAKDPEPSDPDLGQALGDANRFHIELIKTKQKHEMDMAAAERGWLGWLLGGQSHAPTFIAFLIAAAGLLVSVWCLTQAAARPAEADFWAKQSERGFGLVATAVGFIFGRNLK